MTFHTIGLFVTNDATGWMAKVARKMLITGIYFSCHLSFDSIHHKTVSYRLRLFRYKIRLFSFVGKSFLI